MLLVLRIVIAALALSISFWALVTGINDFSPYMLLFLAAMFLAIAVFEMKAKRKKNAVISYLASAFIFFISFYTFLR
ncbi:DUF3953 domain-containing protein [Metabacillus litoralis]|uniref:DUF3953 domain-containing protein n=1 Tax=Metabacillus litoralis TaxID=152268 RepID=UPI001CFC7DB7|nr:DUF3953 domain-containing protein [Metabacillus litoralis]